MNRRRDISPRGWLHGQLRKSALMLAIIAFLPAICLGAVRLAPILVGIELVLFLYWLIRRLKARRR